MTLTFNAHRGTVITRTYTVAYRCKEASQRSLNSKTGVVSAIDVKTFFYFGHVFGVFRRFFYFPNVFYLKKRSKFTAASRLTNTFKKQQRNRPMIFLLRVE